MAIISEFIQGRKGISFDQIKVTFDDSFYEAITKGDYSEFVGLGEKVADLLAEKLYTMMEKKVLSDPVFKRKILNDVLIRIANRIADKGLLKKKK